MDSVESALAAKAGGADRLEICSGLPMGGLSPSPCLFRRIKETCGDLKLHVLLRPGWGISVILTRRFEIIREEVKMFRELGADGVVIGILTPEGELDVERMRKLVKEAEGMSVTLHRAFDMCIAPQEALEEAVALGIRTILTSGQRNSAAEGADLLELLVELADNRITIMPGAGVSPENLPLLDRTDEGKSLSYDREKSDRGKECATASPRFPWEAPRWMSIRLFSQMRSRSAGRGKSWTALLRKVFLGDTI